MGGSQVDANDGQEMIFISHQNKLGKVHTEELIDFF